MIICYLQAHINFIIDNIIIIIAIIIDIIIHVIIIVIVVIIIHIIISVTNLFKNVFTHIIMSSSFLAISLLKQSLLPEKQLRIFLSHLAQQSLKEYLSEANIYKGKRNMNKIDLIDMIISNRDKSKIDTQED